VPWHRDPRTYKIRSIRRERGSSIEEKPAKRIISKWMRASGNRDPQGDGCRTCAIGQAKCGNKTEILGDHIEFLGRPMSGAVEAKRIEPLSDTNAGPFRN
jgi:hypothetical protein